MPLPFLIAAAVWIGGAATATAATVTAIATTSILTIGGISITIGGLTAAAAAFGIATKIFEDTDSYSNGYISDEEKQFEKNKLKDKLEILKSDFRKLKNKERVSELKKEMNNVLLNSKKLEEDEEYFKAIHVINSYQLIYAEKKTDMKIAKETEDIAKFLIKIRKQTISLRK